MINYDEAHRIFRYDPVWGKLYYRIDRGTQGIRGREVGWVNDGYRKTKIDGKCYSVHRIIWLMVYGNWPNNIDHVNHAPDDNRIENLRSVTHHENLLNQKLQKNNKSGIVGVRWCGPRNKWLARISINKNVVHLGYFDNIFEAACARKSAENKNGYHQNHGA